MNTMLTAAINEAPTGRGNWMQTLSGRQFFPADPRPGEIWIRDVAGSLARQCRFGGAWLAQMGFYLQREARDGSTSDKAQCF
jgi:hypothetical protein